MNSALSDDERQTCVERYVANQLEVVYASDY